MCGRCFGSVCCRNISTMRPEDGAAHCKSFIFGYYVIVVSEVVLSRDDVIPIEDFVLCLRFQ